MSYIPCKQSDYIGVQPQAVVPLSDKERVVELEEFVGELLSVTQAMPVVLEALEMLLLKVNPLFMELSCGYNRMGYAFNEMGNAVNRLNDIAGEKGLESAPSDYSMSIGMMLRNIEVLCKAR